MHPETDTAAYLILLVHLRTVPSRQYFNYLLKLSPEPPFEIIGTPVRVNDSNLTCESATKTEELSWTSLPRSFASSLSLENQSTLVVGLGLNDMCSIIMRLNLTNLTFYL